MEECIRCGVPIRLATDSEKVGVRYFGKHIHENGNFGCMLPGCAEVAIPATEPTKESE